MDQCLNLSFPLDRFYQSDNRHVPRISRIDGKDIPDPYRALLVGNHDMTPTLEAFHGGRIEIQTLDRSYDVETLGRIVVLRMQGSTTPVEFGAIIIHLDLVPPEARETILECRIPFGTILASYCIEHVSRPRAFICVEPDELMAQVLNLKQPVTLYGRRNVISNLHNEVLADIIEVLPA
jgi:chorismate-pyruvate lyase